MNFVFPARAALSLAIGLTAPILSSACAHDLPPGGSKPLQSYDTRSYDARSERIDRGRRYAAPPRTLPRRVTPGAALQRPSGAGRDSGPTYVEATFERRKSAVGPPYRERFHGFAQNGPGGRATIEIQNVGETVRCTGRSRVTRPPTGPGAAGLRGEAFISCDDGRYAIADYRYVTNTRGAGEGRDNLGNRFTIRFMIVP